MVIETTDCSNKEQVVLAFRWLHEGLAAHEEFGLYLTDSITSAALVAIIEDTIVYMNIKLEHCHGQCYDKTSTSHSVVKLCTSGTNRGTLKR